MNYGETVGISVIIHDSIWVTSIRKKVPAPSLTEVGTEWETIESGWHACNGRLEWLTKINWLNNLRLFFFPFAVEMEEEAIAVEFLFTRINNTLYISRLYCNLSHQPNEVLFASHNTFLIGLCKETHLQVSCDYFEHTLHLSLMTLWLCLMLMNSCTSVFKLENIGTYFWPSVCAVAVGSFKLFDWKKKESRTPASTSDEVSWTNEFLLQVVKY